MEKLSIIVNDEYLGGIMEELSTILGEERRSTERQIKERLH
jgi:hypothetical protein